MNMFEAVYQPDDRISVPPEVSSGASDQSGGARQHEAESSHPPQKPRRYASKVAVEIGRDLCENGRFQFLEVERGIQFFGLEKVRELVEKAKQIHSTQGMPVETGERLRTLGGVFFYLLRGEIFAAGLGWPRKPPPATLQDCRRVAETMVPEGDLRSITLTLTGRPKSIREEKGTVIVLMQEQRIPSSIPKLLPPIRDASTTYAVYVVAKQWRKVEPALEDPDDTLVVEGYPRCDLKLGHIEVYAIMVTTKGMIRKAAEAARRASAST